MGVTLNLFASQRRVTVNDDLPIDVVSAEIDESPSGVFISYKNRAGDEKRWSIKPFKDADAKADSWAASIDELRQYDPIAATIYDQHGGALSSKVGAWFKRLGGLFLRMLQMVSVPLIVTSLMTGVLGLGKTEGVGRMFRRTISYYLVTSVLAIVTGLFVVNVVRPGLSNEAPTFAETKVEHAKSLGQVLFEQLEAMIPSNPLSALTAPNFLSIIAFTIAFSVFTLSVGGHIADRIAAAATAGFEVMMAMTTAIIRLAPLGVFFLIAAVTATQGAGVFQTLGKYMLAVSLGLAIHALMTLPLILKFVAKRSPIEFAKAMSPALLTAFSSASSNGTLPLTLSSVERRANISNRTGSFVLPLGATINMDGTALRRIRPYGVTARVGADTGGRKGTPLLFEDTQDLVIFVYFPASRLCGPLSPLFKS